MEIGLCEVRSGGKGEGAKIPSPGGRLIRQDRWLPVQDPLKNVFCFPSNAWVAMAGMIEAIRIHRFWTVNCFFCFIPSLLISRIITDVNSSGRASFRLFSPNGFEHLRMKQG
jgi:hypothetical protein